MNKCKALGGRMTTDIYKLEKDEYFKSGESIYIHRSDNVGFNGIMHKHNFIELIYVISGRATHHIDNQSYVVKKGNVFIVDYGVPHSLTLLHDDVADEPFETYDLLFTPNFFNVSGMTSNEFYSLASSYLFSSLFTEFDSSSAQRNLIKSGSKEFRMLFEKIYEEYQQREKGFQNIIRAYLIELIIKLFRAIDKQKPTFTQSHYELVQKAIEHMRKNYKAHISLDDVVSGIFLSKNYFRQIFKKETGISISSFIQKMRLDEARRLLVTTDKSSSVISEECGFNDLKFFYLTFKRATGMTPTEYRRLNKKQSE